MRLRLLAAVPLVVAVGLAARFLLDGALANFLGVALWSVLVFLVIRLIRPSLSPLAAGGAALAVSFAVELFQLTGIPLRLAEISVLFRLALGTHFDPNDLFAYAAGCAGATLLHLLAKRRRASA